MNSVVPADHPAQILGKGSDSDDYTYLDVQVSGGHRVADETSLMRWHATVTVEHDYTVSTVPVASMGLTVVNPYLGDPLEDLDARDQDAYELGSALWDGTSRTDEFDDIATDDGGHVLLIDTYVVEPDWRGTPVTALVALRVLDVFGHLGITAAALMAAPMSDDISEESHGQVADKIAAMWEQVGFVRLDPDRRVMAMSFDCDSIALTMRELAGNDPVLRRSLNQ